MHADMFQLTFFDRGLLLQQLALFATINDVAMTSYH